MGLPMLPTNMRCGPCASVGWRAQFPRAVQLEAVVSMLSDRTDFDSAPRNGTEPAGRVEPSLTLQSRSQIRVMPENSESACRGFDSRRRGGAVDGSYQLKPALVLLIPSWSFPWVGLCSG